MSVLQGPQVDLLVAAHGPAERALRLRERRRVEDDQVPGRRRVAPRREVVEDVAPAGTRPSARCARRCAAWRDRLLGAVHAAHRAAPARAQCSANGPWLQNASSTRRPRAWPRHRRVLPALVEIETRSSGRPAGRASTRSRRSHPPRFPRPAGTGRHRRRQSLQPPDRGVVAHDDLGGPDQLVDEECAP